MGKYDGYVAYYCVDCPEGLGYCERNQCEYRSKKRIVPVSTM